MDVMSILLVSDDATLVSSIEETVRSIRQLHLTVVPTLDEAWLHLDNESVILSLIHLRSREETAAATQLIRKISASKKPLPTLILSDKHHADQGVNVLRAGAVDYLSRPLDLNRLSYLVEVLTVRVRFQAPQRQASPAPSNGLLQSERARKFTVLPTEPMGQILEQVRKVAPMNSTVLLQGETGSGKTRLARMIHDLSGRRDHPFMVVNCGSLSANLIESEMFGHVKGAFTGAQCNHTGKFSEVGQGTLLLDDIDGLPLDLQTKLLRVVEERVFEPVGSNKTQPMRARLIVASNHDLQALIHSGCFRSDLYYRLNVIGFFLPPLRQRRSLIRPLAFQFLDEYAALNNLQVRGISPEALQILEEYDWPGNIRELQNVLEQAVTFCNEEEIQPTDLPANLIRDLVPAAMQDGYAQGNSSLVKNREQTELACIADALSRHKNNRLRAAAELGISRMTLYKKLHKYNLL